MKRIFLFLMGVCLVNCVLCTETNPCEPDLINYPLGASTSVAPGYLVYWFRNNPEKQPIPDSVWVTPTTNTAQILLVSHALPLEKIEIPMLANKSYYFLFARLGDCLKATRFAYYNIMTDLSIPSEKCVRPYKIFRNGQLLIECGSNVYTIQGIEVK